MIEVINTMQSGFTLLAKDTIDGRAYMDKEGVIYICNSFSNGGGTHSQCFSICGLYVLSYENRDIFLKEVDLTITVRQHND